MKKITLLLLMLVMFTGCGQRFKQGDIIINKKTGIVGVVVLVWNCEPSISYWFKNNYSGKVPADMVRKPTETELRLIGKSISVSFPHPKTDLELLQDEIKELKEKCCEKEEKEGHCLRVYADKIKEVEEPIEWVVDQRDLLILTDDTISSGLYDTLILSRDNYKLKNTTKSEYIFERTD